MLLDLSTQLGVPPPSVIVVAVHQGVIVDLVVDKNQAQVIVQQQIYPPSIVCHY